MSVMTIDAESYRKLLLDQYGYNRSVGIEPETAMQLAKRLMEKAFVSDEDVQQNELQRDKYESGIYG